MDQEEITARTCWGLCADPGDRWAHALVRAQGPVAALERLRSRDSSRAIVRSLARAMEVDESVVTHIDSWRARDSPERTALSVERQVELGVGVMSDRDPRWPVGLLDLGDHQALSLWFLGDPQLLQVTPGFVGMVGSRQASPSGVSATRSLVVREILGKRGVISGGATGIDTAAHGAALERGIPTVAVVAGGLDRLYPAENLGMFSRIAASGVLLAEAPCGVRPAPERFLDRNRLIAALASVVVVVEAAHRSGALNTAHHAASLGREVAVVPGRWSDPLSAGCWRLVREQSAGVLSEPGDLALLGAGAPGFLAEV
ncbi:MAG: DNA-protecting protein DprA [Pontimonas sp.]|nr:DNA-protecting protein DprA [Pontimonas sp.]